MPKFNELNVSTIREFDGGLNVVTSELNLSTKYSTVEENMFYGISGAKQKRYGTKYFVDVKKYSKIEETYSSCDIVETKTITIPQDTAHSVNANDEITISAPTALAGTYTVTHNYVDRFTITLNAVQSQTQYTNISYTCHGVTQTAETVSINGTTAYFSRNKNPVVAAESTINITSPSNYEGEHTVLYADNSTIKIDVTGCTQSATGTTVNYTYDKTITYSKTGNISATSTTKTLEFDYADESKNSLLIGHKLKITSPSSVAGTYTIIARDSECYKIDISEKTTSGTSITNVSIEHDNRNITGTSIVDATYFLNKLIAVTNIGEVLAIDAEGNAIIIFNDDIAIQNNVDIDAGWGTTAEVCFAVFNGKLTLWNGRNKPLCVDLYANVPCNFLVDEATQTNTKIPIAKYAIAINHYMVIGNCYNEEDATWNSDRIYISDYDTIATFNDGSDDYLENGGIYVDLGKIASTSTSEIRGLSRYRTQLIVGFDEVTVIGTLGNQIDAKTNDDVEYKLHKPDFSDVINDYGCLGNRTYQTILGDVVCLSYDGVGLFRKQVLSSLTTAAKLSTVIGPKLYSSFKDLTQDTLNSRIWSVYNPKEQQYMLFIPNNSTTATTTETLCYVYTVPSTAAQTKATTGAWSLFKGWNFQWGCTSALNEVFFGNGTKIYVLGNSDREYYADFIDDPAYPADDESGLTGKAIKFNWEFGWQDMNNRVAKKTMRYIGITSTGTAQYTFGTWYDYLKDDDCEMSIDLVGGDANGWGNGRQRYGGGRRTSTEELFAYTAKFDLIKLKISGESKEDLKISGISMHYLVGNMRR